MDDLTFPHTVTRCPVPDCPWKYDLTVPRPRLAGGRPRVEIPPPEGEHLRPDEIAAGIAARRPVLRAAPPIATVSDAADLIMRAAAAQDEAVAGAHLAGHTTAELAAAFPGQLGEVLSRLVRAGFAPAA